MITQQLKANPKVTIEELARERGYVQRAVFRGAIEVQVATLTIEPGQNLADMIEVEWKHARSTGVGGSELPALYDVHPQVSRYSLFHDKANGTRVEPDDKDTAFGVYFEDGTRTWLARELESEGWELYRPEGRSLLYRPGFIRSLTTLDGWASRKVTKPSGTMEVEEAIVEVKVIRPNQFDAWKNGPPLRVQCQVQQYLGVTGLDLGIVAVARLGADFKRFEIRRNDVFIRQAQALIEAFWVDVIQGRAPEFDAHDASCELAIELAKTLDPTRDMVRLPESAVKIVNELLKGRAMEKEGKALSTKAKGQLAAWIGSAPGGLVPDGRCVKHTVSNVAGGLRKTSVRQLFRVDDESED